MENSRAYIPGIREFKWAIAAGAPFDLFIIGKKKQEAVIFTFQLRRELVYLDLNFLAAAFFCGTVNIFVKCFASSPLNRTWKIPLKYSF